MKIIIRNLPIDVDNEDLKEFFTEYGEVKSARVIRDHHSGLSRGFGYVEMPDDAAARKAMKELDKGKIEGQEIYVMEARPKTNQKNSRQNKTPFRQRNIPPGWREKKK